MLLPIGKGWAATESEDRMLELLTPEEMGRADRLAIAAGPYSGLQLMRNAGRAIAAEILRRYPESVRADLLCGPGNNGGDGYVVANELKRTGMDVALYALAPPRPGSDAAAAARECAVEAQPLPRFEPAAAALVVDALFGAGLQRPLDGSALKAVEKLKAAGCRTVAVDLPSGLSGDTGQVMGAACPAELTVTFFRKKPGHLLQPGRTICGEVVLTDIGIGENVLREIGPHTFENGPALWLDRLPSLETDTHKYSRGAVGVFSGGPSSTGAARLAAMAAQRAGAGAVTVLSPPSAVLVNAAHLTSIMLRAVNGANDAAALIDEGRTAALVIGPGFGVGDRLRDTVAAALAPRPCGDGRGLKGVVLDADALTAFAGEPGRLIALVKTADIGIVLTPHDGEFARLFADLAADEALSKIERARAAAARAGATVVLKGSDTVIAAPDGLCAINANAPPHLATAGSGDVLAGIVAAFLAQGMAPFYAAAAAVWLHGEAGHIAGEGLIAEDLPAALPEAFRRLRARHP